MSYEIRIWKIEKIEIYNNLVIKNSYLKIIKIYIYLPLLFVLFLIFLISFKNPFFISKPKPYFTFSAPISALSSATATRSAARRHHSPLLLDTVSVATLPHTAFSADAGPAFERTRCRFLPFRVIYLCWFLFSQIQKQWFSP